MVTGTRNIRLHLLIGKLFLILLYVALTGCLNGENVLPRAIAGFPQTVTVGTVVKLDGRLSFDPNGDEITYAWTLTELPEGSSSVLENATSPETFFTVDMAGKYLVTLTVNDGVGDSAPDTVIITATIENSRGGNTDPSVNHPAVTGTCESCHNGIDATGKSATHIATNDSCAACHRLDAWLPGTVDHGQVLGVCSSCHDGAQASGKSASHIVTSEPCNRCHNVTSWLAAVDPRVPGSPSPNPGKPANHISSTDRCEACHVNGSYAPPVALSHAEVIGTCESCHDGVIATGKFATHVVTNRQCNVCHTTTAWVPALDPAQVTEKPATHLPTSNECTACHAPDAWLPAVVDHTQVLGACVNCHDGVLASGKLATHIASTDVCAACHEVFPAHWVPVVSARVDHTQVLGVCSNCHGLPAVHVVTQDECDVCHATTAWAWLPAPAPAPAPGPGPGNGNVPDHTTLVGTCVSCHDGVNASGKSRIHLPTSDLCETCHESYPAPWVPVLAANVDHAQVVGACVDCHNGQTASGVSPTHPAFNTGCEACHRPAPATWLGGLI